MAAAGKSRKFFSPRGAAIEAGVPRSAMEQAIRLKEVETVRWAGKDQVRRREVERVKRLAGS